MYVAERGTRDGDSRAAGWLTRKRLALYSCVLLALQAIWLVVWAWTSHGFSGASHVARPGIDYSVFWAASHVMLHETPSLVYDHLAFAKIEAALFAAFENGAFMPWLYPPTFLLVVTPLALLPFLPSYLLFVGLSTFTFVIGTLRVSGLVRAIGGRLSVLLLAASPCVFVVATIGQNSLLSAGLAALAVSWTDRHPVRAGLCIGLLAFKPQMALLFPFVLIAAGAWRVIGAAAISASVFTLLSVLVCGTDTVHLFMLNVSMIRETLIEHGEHFWYASPTTFALLRLGGAPLSVAYVAQGCVAVVGAVAACHVWRCTHDARLRCAVLFVATLLTNTYVWHYELAWLGVALACIITFGLGCRWLAGEQEILALAWLLPVYEYFNRSTHLPQIGPFVLLLVLLVIVRRVRIVSAGSQT